MDLVRRRQAWSSYWASGSTDSCVGGVVCKEDGVIRRFWGRASAGLTSGSRVLDVATGNGSVPRTLVEWLPDGACIDAVDMAELKPQWLDPTPGSKVHFHSGVAMESLPFPSAHFELVTSQFGLEYGRWPQSVDEVVRVCKPDGSVALILHHVDSLVVRLGRIESGHQQFLLGNDGIVAAALALVPHLARVVAGEAPDAQATACRQSYNSAMAVLAQRLTGDAPDLLLEARQHVHTILGHVGSAGAVVCLDALHAYARSLEEACVRTQELLACALDPERCMQLVQRLQQGFPGRSVTAEPLVQDGDILGWGVQVA